MRRYAFIGGLAALGLSSTPASALAAGPESGVAALQVALRAKKLYPGPIDGIAGPMTKTALVTLQKRKGLAPDGVAGPATRRVLGALGKPLLGQRELSVGLRGWDVASLEFRLVRYGLPIRAVDGRFTTATAG
ncbi:MAG: peptidoglycan-binding protein, partial [Deltaproteobacteria bacterium]|nr:peptidoglycan-binding protein [Deltaproteobacteria bacterium]